MDTALRSQVEAWIDDDPDPAARGELSALLAAGGEIELRERFGARLRFGTAGLRGPLRAGPNGMNRAVVRRAAAGFAAYLDGAPGGERTTDSGRAAGGEDVARIGPPTVAGSSSRSVVVGYDGRHGSAAFAQDCAAVLAGAGVRVRLLPGPLPTPVLAFAVRALGADGGMMITASHNPPQDNGCKVYLGDGAQIVPPIDQAIEGDIDAVGRVALIPLADPGAREGERPVEAYVAQTAALSLIAARDVTVVATAMHGVGRTTLEAVFARAGFAVPAFEPSQADPDPDFPTVAFPNPEEPGAMDRVLALGAERGADLVIAVDPDADRCAAAVGGRILRGDEVGALLADHVLRHGPGPVATTVVSSSLLAKMAAAHGVGFTETLTGFKWIVRADPELVFGYEEALGYTVGPRVVRDKDGISAALLLAERVAELKAEGRTLLDRLDDLAREHGVHATEQVSVRVADLGRIAAAMRRVRAAPPQALGGIAVEEVHDLLAEPGTRAPSDVVVMRLAGDARVVVRPSGTEPKLKAYLEAVVPVAGGDLDGARERAAATLQTLRSALPTVLGIG